MKLLTCLLCGFLSWSVVAQVGADFDHDRIDWIYGVNPVFDSLKDHIPTSLLSLADSLTINETSYPRRESLLISDSVKSLELSSSSADFRIVLMYNEGDLDGEQRMYRHNHLAQRAIYQNGKLVNPYTKAKQIVSSYLQQDVGTDSSYFQLGIDSTLTSVQFYRTDSCLSSLQKREDLYNWEIFSDGVQAPVNLWFTSFVKHEMNLISDKTEYRIRFSGMHKGFFSANVYLGEDENDYPMIMGRYELFLFYYNYELGVIQCYSHIDVTLH